MAGQASAARSSVAVAVGTLATALLGGLLAVIIALVVGEGPRTDAFFAAYSLYLFFALFGATLRVALVPLMGSVADEQAWRGRAADVLRRLTGVAAVVAAAVAALSPLLARVLTSGLGDAATTTATLSLAILAVATYCQIAAAALAAALAAARRFSASAGLYVAASVTTLTAATTLMLLVGIIGAALGILAGSVLLLAGHHAYLARFGFRLRPAPQAARQAATWRLTARSCAGAAIPLGQQLALTIALACVAGEVGAVTAYTYAYFVGAFTAALTINVISFVMLPGLMGGIEHDGEEVIVDYLRFLVPLAVYLFLPVALAYASFGRPLLDAVLGGSLSAGTIDLLWDASRLFLAMNLILALLTPLSAVLLALGRLRALVTGVAVLLPVHTVSVLVAVTAAGPVAAATAHALAGAALVVPVLAAGFGGGAWRVVAQSVAPAWPAAVLALVFVPLALVASDPGWLASLGLGAAGVAAYVALGTLAWPAVAGRAVHQLLARG